MGFQLLTLRFYDCLNNGENTVCQWNASLAVLQFFFHTNPYKSYSFVSVTSKVAFMVYPSLVLFMVKRLIELYPIMSALRSRGCELPRALYFLSPQTLVIYSLPTLNFASQIARSCNKNAEKKRGPVAV